MRIFLLTGNGKYRSSSSLVSRWAARHCGVGLAFLGELASLEKLALGER
jgi:hypothetical protein